MRIEESVKICDWKTKATYSSPHIDNGSRILEFDTGLKAQGRNTSTRM